MLMVLGLPAARTKRSGTRLAPAAPIRTERRESMTTSEYGSRQRVFAGANSGHGGGNPGPAHQRGNRASPALCPHPTLPPPPGGGGRPGLPPPPPPPGGGGGGGGGARPASCSLKSALVSFLRRPV